MKAFEVGEKVVCVSSNGFDGLVVGEQYTVDGIYNSQSISVKEVKDFVHYTKRFDKLVCIAKPILEERKTGKVKMQLFDEGFPNAVMEITKVMSWAEQNKGYKPNDFKKLPNADVEFSAAASRHKLKGLIQKDAGLPPLERVDEESGIVHLAHQCFNALAELELVLTGRIKE